MMTSTQDAVHLHFSAFMGKLLSDVSEHFAPAGEPGGGAIPAGLAGLWSAAGAALGVVQLREIVREHELLRGLLRQTLSLPQASEDEEARLALELGTALHRFAAHLDDDDAEEALRHRYTTYLEGVERSYQSLEQERDEDTISEEEFKQEIEGLYLQSMYALMRLQRM